MDFHFQKHETKANFTTVIFNTNYKKTRIKKTRVLRFLFEIF